MNRTVWTNHELQPSAERYLREELERRGDRLVQSAASSRSVLLPGEPDPSLAEVDIAYGQQLAGGRPKALSLGLKLAF